MKLKTYRLYWTATVEGIQEVQAANEDDAREQFDSCITWDMIPDEPMNGELYDIELVVENKKSARK